MRVLLDEDLPTDLVSELSTHEIKTVVGMGWGGVKNGELLRRVKGHFEVFNMLAAVDGITEGQLRQVGRSNI